MPAVAHRGTRRRTISEINMVPFIDVMLVLLIIFMVTAPLITAGVVDLPTVGKARQRSDPHVIELVVGADEALRLRVDGKDAPPLALADLAARVALARTARCARGTKPRRSPTSTSRRSWTSCWCC